MPPTRAAKFSAEVLTEEGEKHVKCSSYIMERTSVNAGIYEVQDQKAVFRRTRSSGNQTAFAF